MLVCILCFKIKGENCKMVYKSFWNKRHISISDMIVHKVHKVHFTVSPDNIEPREYFEHRGLFALKMDLTLIFRSRSHRTKRKLHFKYYRDATVELILHLHYLPLTMMRWWYYAVIFSIKARSRSWPDVRLPGGFAMLCVDLVIPAQLIAEGK